MSETQNKLRKKAFILSFALTVLLCVSGCDLAVAQRPYTYIKTERGLMHYGSGYCELGMLVNNGRFNIYDEKSTPITCSGYIQLTVQQAADYKEIQHSNNRQHYYTKRILIMNKCSPVEMRNALELVEVFKKTGIRFVPMPVFNDDDQEKTVSEMQEKLSAFAEDGEAT